MTEAIPAKGFRLYRSDDGGANYDLVPEVFNVDVSDSTDKIDATHHGSGSHKEYITSLSDFGVTGELSFIPDDTIHLAMRTDKNAKTSRYFQVKNPDDSVYCTFQAFIEKFDIKAPVAGKLDCSFSLVNSATVVYG